MKIGERVPTRALLNGTRLDVTQLAGAGGMKDTVCVKRASSEDCRGMKASGAMRHSGIRWNMRNEAS